MGFYEPKNDGKRDGQVKRNIVSGFIYKRITGYILCTKIFSLSNRYIKKEGTKYEIEYLIAGKDSEKENLGAVFWKMIALRFLTNAACVYQDPVKEKEATLLAASVLGITGFPSCCSCQESSAYCISLWRICN